MLVCCKNFFWEKDLFTEGKATVSYSSYRVVDCKIFWFIFLEGYKKGQAVLIGIRLTETVGLLLLLL